MFTNLVLLVTTLFISGFLQTDGSTELCEVDSLSDYLTGYLALPYSCDEIYITKRTEVLTARKLKEATELITSIKIIGGIKGIQTNCFRYKSNVRNITIVGNNLPTFTSFAFTGLSLVELNLTRNNIVELGLNPFGNSSIKKLDLSYNKISTLLKTHFSTQLLDIRISRNRLSYIEPECFHSELQFLELEYNLLHYITRDHFSNLKNLKELYLGNNRIVTVDFSGNDLKKLVKLDLSYNQIENLNRASFVSLENLKFLNLTSNRIKWISSTTLQIFWELTTLDLSLNYLTNFPYSSLPSSIKVFNAFGNPWNCECFSHMEKYLVYNKIIFNCDSVSTNEQFCIYYGNRCSNKANDTLVAAFMENKSTKLRPYCNGPALPRGEIETIYPLINQRPFQAVIRKHQFK